MASLFRSFSIELLRHSVLRLLWVGIPVLACLQPLPVSADPPSSETPAEANDQATDIATAEADPEASDQPFELSFDFTDYFEAYKAALAAQKDLLIYCCDSETPSADQTEFETDALRDASIRAAIDEQFVFVKIATDAPVQTRSTVTKTSYVRSGFRRIKKTYNQTVVTDLFDGKTRSPGVLVVQVTQRSASSEPDIVAHFPFRKLEVSPHVFRVDHEFKPWEKEVFRDIVLTPVSSTDVYLTAFCSKRALDSSCVQRDFRDDVASLGGVHYDYGYTSENLSPNAVVTQVHIAGNTRLASFEQPIAMRVDAYSLRDSAVPVQYAYAEIHPTDQWQTLRIDGLAPETPYRLNAYFYTPGSTPQLIGKAEVPLYAATSGSGKLAETRAAIAMKALSEVNDWKRGRYNYRKGYVVGRWCERFYCWNVLNFIRIPYRDGYSSSTFSRYNALFSGRTMRNIVENQNVMGDHIRISGHGFMVLSYDRHLGQAWTIEGNFGNRVVLTRRNVQNYWSLGNIVPEMIREEDG